VWIGAIAESTRAGDWSHFDSVSSRPGMAPIADLSHPDSTRILPIRLISSRQVFKLNTRELPECTKITTHDLSDTTLLSLV
jgi:hypothetical protein